MNPNSPARIANISGYYGDRLSALTELLEGPPVHYITGDYLAELTMLILAKDQQRNKDAGYAKTFLPQILPNLRQIAELGTKVIVNAGGLNPAGLASALQKAIKEQGLELQVSYIDGDDLIDQAEMLGFSDTISANAYLGAFGIVECLKAGADIVLTGRVTDASLVVGPAAYHFDWSREDFDKLAGAMAAGHVIECGTQATGGNYSFFNRGEISDPLRPGYPIAEINADGSSIITKQPGTGGAVTPGTVSAQLLYEVTGPEYAGPDATLNLDSVQITSAGANRVLLSGITGTPPPATTKVCVNRLGGYRNQFTVYLTGLHAEQKAELFHKQLAAERHQPQRTQFRLARTDHADAADQAAATATLTCVAWDDDPQVIDRWTRAAVGIGLATFPGAFFDQAPPKPSAFGVYEPAFVPNYVPQHRAHLPQGEVISISPPATTTKLGRTETVLPIPNYSPSAAEPHLRVPIGQLVQARSGDKGGDANLGIWVDDPDAYGWLVHTFTADLIGSLLPEVASYQISRYPLPNLNAVNFVIHGILGSGVADGARFDAQAKGLGEWLRSRYLDIPERFLRNAPAWPERKN